MPPRCRRDPEIEAQSRGALSQGPSGAGATWTVDARASTSGDRVVTGEGAKPDCTVTIADADLVAMAEGRLSGMSAFMGGKMKIKGNMGLAQKFGALLANGPPSKM